MNIFILYFLPLFLLVNFIILLLTFLTFVYFILYILFFRLVIYYILFSVLMGSAAVCEPLVKLRMAKTHRYYFFFICNVLIFL